MEIGRHKKARKQKRTGSSKENVPFFLFPGMANSVKPFFTYAAEQY